MQILIIELGMCGASNLDLIYLAKQKWKKSLMLIRAKFIWSKTQ